MIKSIDKNSITQIITEKNAEYEAVQNDFREITKKVMILKDRFLHLEEEDITAYFAESVEETLKSISRVLTIIEMNKK